MSKYAVQRTFKDSDSRRDSTGETKKPLEVIPSRLFAKPTISAVNLLLKYLESEGVEYVFGIPGGPLMPFYEALADHPKITHILAKHESGAAFMADGYARARRALGVCCVTTGPGATNAVTGIASAYADGIPVLIITAQVATSAFGKGAFQETSAQGIDIVEMFKPITKASLMLMRADKMGETIRYLLRVARSGRPGPVHLNIPADLAKKIIEDEEVIKGQSTTKSHSFDRDAVKRAAQYLANAKKPAILAGSGVNFSNAYAELRRISEKLQIPVATTAKAKGVFPENHLLSLGVFGFSGSPRAESYLLEEDIDVLLTIGTSLGETATNAWDPRLAPKEALLQIDIDQEKMGQNYPADVALLGDAKTILTEILFHVDRETKWIESIENKTMETIEKVKNQHTRCLDEDKMVSNEVPLKPQRLMQDVNDSLPKDAMLFVEIGNSMSWAFHYLKITTPHSFFHSLGLASMGYALTSCIGAKLANPERPVVALCGDSAFLMNGSEIHTACENNIPIVWIIENNGGHGMIYHGEKVQFRGRFHNSLFNQKVDFCKFAESLGAMTYRVTEPGELCSVLKKAIDSKLPTVIDAHIDLEEGPPMGSRFKALNRFFQDKV